MTTHLPITILGGGLGGLVAARVLHTRGILAVVLDLEADRHARTQGGMLDLHEESGQAALRTAGLWEGFTALVHEGGQSMRILDHEAHVLREEPDDGSGDRPEVDRGALRDLLIDSLPADAIRWSAKVIAVEPLGGGRHRIDLADRTSLTTDLLIGADGAWSKVRPLLSDAWPAYSGVSFVEADLFDADAAHPAEAAAVGRGMLFALHGETGILAHRESDGSLHVYLGLKVPEAWIDTVDFADDEAARRTVLDRLTGWDPALRGLIEHADTPLTPRRIAVLPVGVRWDRTAGVTLLGDAAHVMSPFAGEGANLAMADGADLALAIARHRDDVETALAEYEAVMLPRAAEAAAESARNLEVIFAEDSPRGLLELFAGFDERVAPVAADLRPHSPADSDRAP